MLRLKPSAQLWLCWTLPMAAEVPPALRLGIDLGGSKIAGVVLDRTGASLAQHRIAAPQHDYAATLRAIVEMVGTLQQSAGGSGTVGIGMPGSIAPGGGGVQNANSTWLNGRPFAHDLAQVLNMPVRLANDANCFALSEAVDGAGAGARSLFGVILGTGCGGGLIFEGKLIDGPRGTGGEWGHNPLPWAEASEHPGPLCWCGRRGCHGEVGFGTRPRSRSPQAYGGGAFGGRHCRHGWRWQCRMPAPRCSGTRAAWRAGLPRWSTSSIPRWSCSAEGCRSFTTSTPACLG